MLYKWDNKRGVLDENGNQVLQLVTGNCSKKFRNTAGKELVNKLNTIEQGKALGKQYQQRNGPSGKNI